MSGRFRREAKHLIQQMWSVAVRGIWINEAPGAREIIKLKI
jgi:hypothetical protein